MSSVEFELEVMTHAHDDAIASFVKQTRTLVKCRAERDAALAKSARVETLAGQYAATAAVHADVRDTMPHTEANIRPHVQAKALAGMAQHHADQLRVALEPK